jgi:CHAT domain-containing protein
MSLLKLSQLTRSSESRFRGNILILFVCHSGSMKKALFREKILSLAKVFFNKGYRAVIAPFWSLHISVPPVWLPAFLTSLKGEMAVSEAVFSANSKVYETNKNPGAWACLHLYGDPYLKVE